MELLTALNAQRVHALGIVEGLGEAELRRPMMPSAWTCLGLINHLALDVEMFWFRAVVAADQGAIDELATAGDSWRVGPELSAPRVLDRYRRQIDLADAAIASASLDAEPAWWPTDGRFGDWRLHTNHQVLLHVITETACHAGHLDAARELIDGRQWLPLS